jgi:hypothetical protein
MDSKQTKIFKNKYDKKPKVISTVKSTKEFDIDRYLNKSQYDIFLEEFKKNIEVADFAYGIPDKMITLFLEYIKVNDQMPNCELTTGMPEVEITNIKKSNAKYIFFLARLLIYIVHEVLKLRDDKKTKILSNIKTFLTYVEENSITGVFNMYYGINLSYYDEFGKQKIDNNKYLFHVNFMTYYKNLFATELCDIYENPDYKLCAYYGDDINKCNTISNSTITQLIEHLLKKEGGQKIVRKVKLLKKYKV